MPIKHFKGGDSISGDSITYFRMCVLRSAVGMELAGLKVRRGPAVWKQVAREFHVPGNKQAVYDWLVAKVDELRPQQEHVVEEGGRKVRTVGGVEIT